MRSVLLLLCACVSLLAQVGRINAGGPALTDALGQAWQADTYFTGGAVSTGPIPAGAPAYYITKRYGDFYYLLPVPDGQYTVTLGFLGNVVPAGQRIFNVLINGVPVLTNYDIAADVGMNVPVRKAFNVTAAGAGIKIQFVTVLRSAVVNSIEFAPVAGRAITCTSGTIAPSDLTSGAPSQEVQIASIPSGWRYDQVTLCESQRFLGQSIASATASMGRPGTNDIELTGVAFPLGVSANNQNCWTARPTPPTFTGPYTVVVNLAVQIVNPDGSISPGNVFQLTTGLLTWEVCGYQGLIGDTSGIGQ